MFILSTKGNCEFIAWDSMKGYLDSWGASVNYWSLQVMHRNSLRLRNVPTGTNSNLVNSVCRYRKKCQGTRFNTSKPTARKEIAPKMWAPYYLTPRQGISIQALCAEQKRPDEMTSMVLVHSATHCSRNKRCFLILLTPYQTSQIKYCWGNELLFRDSKSPASYSSPPSPLSL